MRSAILISIAVPVAMIGDIVFKRSVSFPWLAFLLYAASGLPVWYAYRHGSWLQIGLLWQTIAVMLTLIVGVIMFSEAVTWRKGLAFALALTAAWLAQSGK